MAESSTPAETKVRLCVTSQMTDPQGQTMRTRNARTGTLRRAGDALELTYDDVQEGERTRVTLTMQPHAVTMRRAGMTRTTLHFTPSERTSSVYATVYGEMPVAIHTREIALSETATGGTLRLCYGVAIAGEHTADTEIDVQWRR